MPACSTRVHFFHFGFLFITDEVFDAFFEDLIDYKIFMRYQ